LLLFEQKNSGTMSDNQEYEKQTEPEYKARSYNWKTAIGLQQVDGLTPSKYLIEIANANISGEISLVDVQRRIAEYYSQKPARSDEEKRSEEADKVATNIAQILANKTFKLSPIELLSVHRQLFNGVFGHAGKIRDCNISKKEWVLGEKSVVYDDYRMARESLDYDFEKEKSFDYSKLDERQTIEHILHFIADLWQIHAFREGNTRTIAVFTIKYLHAFGYDMMSDTFEKHSWYFRNALVRANYSSRQDGIVATQIYLNYFFENLLFGQQHELRNRNLKVL
jgi:fido (protein-threonine AMPylation protein)